MTYRINFNFSWTKNSVVRLYLALLFDRTLKEAL